tara:strand:- start:17 stop:328 length:312 start_codon:yes stop_codon:yes gene_type:complete
MADKPVPGSYIDTQGMGGPADPNYKGPTEPVKHKSMEIRPRRLFTPEYVREMKILINEVLDEREGKFDYTSYFDTDQFKYRVGEKEPPYKPMTVSIDPDFKMP